MATGLGKVSIHFSAKEWATAQLHSFHMLASKVMLRILQARLQQYVNQEFPDNKLDLKKAEEPEIKLPTSVGS